MYAIEHHIMRHMSKELRIKRDNHNAIKKNLETFLTLIATQAIKTVIIRKQTVITESPTVKGTEQYFYY